MNNALEKIANPLKFYKKPLEVEQDSELSLTDKIKLLINWLDDISLQQVAEEENMPAIRDTHYYAADVQRLLKKLKHQAGTPITNNDNN